MTVKVDGVAREVGGFYAMALDTERATFRWPFQWREFVTQFWRIAAVSIGPCIGLMLGFSFFTALTFDLLMVELGAPDVAGVAAAVSVIENLGPIISVLVIGGAGATAICADLGARTIREEISALEVLGIDPIYRLVVPRVVATTVLSVLLMGLGNMFGLAAFYSVAVFFHGATPGGFVENLTLVVGASQMVLATAKAVVFGHIAGLMGCYLGLNVKGGSKGVGEAVNQTVIYSFVALFFFNVLLSAIWFEAVPG
ncbi:MAG: ABC transporter permease [Rhodospirillales bacterium]|nr:ABC transporter permease [Rhodospirillales bacterium]